MSHPRNSVVAVNRRLSVFNAVLSAAFLVAGIIGAAEGKLVLALVGFGTGLFFGWMSYQLSARAARSYVAKHGPDGEYFMAPLFRRLGIRWLVKPDNGGRDSRPLDRDL